MIGWEAIFVFRFSSVWLWHFLRVGYVTVLGGLLYIASLTAAALPAETVRDAVFLALVPRMVESMAAAAMLLTAGCAVGLRLLGESGGDGRHF